MSNSRGWKTLHFSARVEKVSPRNHRWGFTLLCTQKNDSLGCQSGQSCTLEGKMEIPRNQHRFKKNRAFPVFPFPWVSGT